MNFNDKVILNIDSRQGSLKGSFFNLSTNMRGETYLKAEYVPIDRKL